MLVLAPIGAAHADPGDLTLVSTSETGVKGNGSSSRPSISGDGRLVVFTSGATNLDPADTDTVQDAYVKDLLSGEISVVSTTESGVKSNAASWDPHIAADGTRVTFYSSATSLHPSDSDTTFDIYVKDLASGNLVLASASTTGVKGNGSSVGPMLSGDGTMVVFTSDATNLDPSDPDSDSDVYVKDLRTGHLTLASTSDTGEKSNSSSGATSIAADGTAVSFFSSATNLDAVDTDELADAYVKNLVSGDVILASTSSTGEKGNAETYFDSVLSTNGDQLVFDAYALNLHPEANGYLQIYVKDLNTGELVLVSTTTEGKVGNSYSFNARMSADGSTIAFASWAWDLDPGDTDARTDIFVKDLATGELTLASTNASGVKGDDDSDQPTVTADGRLVAFESVADNLDPADTDTLSDIYVKELEPRVPTCDGRPATVVGTAGNDLILGTPRRDVIAAFGGADTIHGGGGNDLVCGDGGNDHVFGGTGNDVVTGGAGDDAVRGGKGNDTLSGDTGTDICRGDAGIDTGDPSCESMTGIPWRATS
jgi:hypothetical protein